MHSIAPRRRRCPRIIGDEKRLEQVITGGAIVKTGVHRFERKWRARSDSNARPSDSQSGPGLCFFNHFIETSL